MKIIGLTGGIASGKSTVSSILRKLGATIIDADIIARKVVERGQPALESIVEYFGRGILMKDGSLNRKKLGEIVFNNREDLRRLNQITHPEINRMTKELFGIERNKGKHRIVYDCPLLIEGNLMHMVDEIWLVYIDEERQIQRLMERDLFTREQAMNRINSQLPLKNKIEYADVIINNNGNIEDLERKVTELWNSNRRL